MNPQSPLPSLSIISLVILSILMPTYLTAWPAAPDAAVLEAEFQWVNTRFTADKYPDMVDPLIINTQEDLDRYRARYSELPPGSKAGGRLAPSGMIFLIVADNPSKDVILDARKLTIPIPVKILEARHVWIIGGDWTLKADPSGAPGTLANTGTAGVLIPAVNLYPRVAGGNMLQVSNSQTLIIEGVDMDAAGHNVDVIVTNTVAGQTPEDALANKRMYFINSRLRGFVGHAANYTGGGPDGSPLGDGFHADAIQYQSETAYHESIYENLVIESGQEGLVATSTTVQANRTVYSKFRATYDERYVDPDKTHWSYIAPMSSNSKRLLIEDCYLYRSEVYNAKAGVLGVNENHMLYWYKSKIMYFTDGNGSTWGNAGYGQAETPVPSGLELDMTSWEPTPRVRGVTPVVKHAGIHTIPGTLSAGDVELPEHTDYAPAAHIGRHYRRGERLY